MKLQLKELMGRCVSELGAPRRAIHCSPQTSILEAIYTLRREKIGSLVVLDDGKVTGIFTERDFVDKVAFMDANIVHEKVSAYMTPNPVCVQRHESIGSVLSKMREGRFRHVIITDSYRHLEKVISMREVMGYLICALLEKRS